MNNVRTQPQKAAKTRQPEPASGDLVSLLRKAREVGASDLHISVGRPLFLRLNGTFRFANEPFSAAETEKLLFGVLSKEQEEYLRERLSLDFCLIDETGFRYRGCIVHQRLGWDGVFRIIGDHIPSFEELGLPEHLVRLTEYHQGLVLIGGAAGSGKTTTLAALLQKVNETRQDHIITVEDPIEYIINPERCRITQRQNGFHTETFAKALRASLREDPDVIMVGEMRDLDTMAMVITAAETGHLVFSTIHTSSAGRTVGAIVDAFPPEQQAQIRTMVAESLRGIICQQLVPSPDGKTRRLALEILISTPAVASIIREGKDELLASEIQTSRQQGMRLMDDSLAELLKGGLIGPEEAAKRSQESKKP